MDPRILELLRLLKEFGYGMVGDLPRSAGSTGPTVRPWPTTEDGGRQFSRLALLLAMHDSGFPLGIDGTAVTAGYTEGFGDLGLDGVAIAIGDQPVSSPEQAMKLCEANPDAPVRVLLLQSKRRNVHAEHDNTVRGGDVAQFGFDCLGWLQADAAAIAKRMLGHANAAAWQQWQIFDALRQAAIGTSGDADRPARSFTPEVTLAFVFSGHWSEHETPESYRLRTVNLIRQALPGARVEVEVLGAQDLAGAADYAGIGLKRDLLRFDGTTIAEMQLPQAWIDVSDAGAARTVSGFIGHAAVKDVLQTFARPRPRRRGGEADGIDLDYRFFLDNPRFYLRLERTRTSGRHDDWNRGARGIEASLASGLADVLGFGHNGVVIVARAATRDKNGTLHLVGPQVINGCQSCFVLAENAAKLGNSFLPVKVVVTQNDELQAFVIRASNTQAAIDDWDLQLGQSSEVRALQRAFMRGASQAPDRVWLQRRWNEHLGEHMAFERTILARDLLEATAASLFGPPGRDRKTLLDRIGEDIFLASHEPTAYRAAAWLLFAHKKWSARQTKGPTYGGGRFQVVHALWRLADATPDDIDITRSERAQTRYQSLIDRIMADIAAGSPLTADAVDCVRAAANDARYRNRALSEVAGNVEFSKLVRTCADQKKAASRS